MVLFWIVLGYIAGSIPFGLVLATLISGSDPRRAGSGNVGATNVTRTCGKKVGAATLLLDLLKGLIIVLLARFTGLDDLHASMVALAVVCGHIFSIFLRFKGGKGVATTAGVFLALALWQGAVAGILCLLIAWKTRYVSLGALVMVSLLPILLLISGRFALVPLSLVIAALLFWSHRENIKRLLQGTEKPWNSSK